MAKTAVVRGSDKKEITVRELEMMDDNSVYVINIAPRAARGEILFSVPRPNGVGEDMVKIPKTWIPVDLTDQVEKKNLLASSRFRTNLNKKLLMLVHPDYARRVLETDRALVEKERIDNLKSVASALAKGSPTTEQNEEDDEYETPTTRRRRANVDTLHENNEPSTSPAHSSTAGQDARFDILVRELAKKRSQDVVINALASEGELTRKELRKVLGTFGHMPKVVKWAERKLG